jgi:hypothetical protein
MKVHTLPPKAVVALPGPTAESVQADMLAKVERTHEMTGEMVALLHQRWDESIKLARAEEVARAKRNDVWIGGGGAALGAALAIGVVFLLGQTMNRNAIEATTQGIVIGKAEAANDALRERANERPEDQGFKRTPNGWQK